MVDVIDVLLGSELGIPPFFPARVANDNTTLVRPEVSESYEVNTDEGVSEALEDGAVLRDYTDRRQWNPDGAEGARTFGGRQSGLRPVGSKMGRLPFRIGFREPSVVVECARRLRRRQSLFAKGYYGRIGYRSRRMGPFSGISCEEF